jgi:hypothetical protein
MQFSASAMVNFQQSGAWFALSSSRIVDCGSSSLKDQDKPRKARSNRIGHARKGRVFFSGSEGESAKVNQLMKLYGA